MDQILVNVYYDNVTRLFYMFVPQYGIRFGKNIYGLFDIYYSAVPSDTFISSAYITRNTLEYFQRYIQQQSEINLMIEQLTV